MMHYMLNEDELKMMQEVSDITRTDYNITGRVIPVDSLVCAIEELLTELHKKESDISDLQNDIVNNYEVKNINPFEEYGVSEKDFV